MAKQVAPITSLHLVEKYQTAYRRELPNPFRPGEVLRVHILHFVASAIPVKAFLDAGAAQEFCKEQERLAWEACNPFHYANKVSDCTRLDSSRLRDWLLDAGLEPPAAKAKVAVWVKWYDTVKPTLTEIQRLKVWEVLDKVRFYRVVELTE
jgi:hypothetical protein